jgi:predicted  nucleic acid-binding Zn-ribbon protein
MEFEQLIKRLDWLDQEHRSTKQAVADLQEQAAAIQSELAGVSKQLKSISKELAGTETAVKRLDQFDTFLSQQRSETSQAIEALERSLQERDGQAAARSKDELDAIHGALAALQTGSIPDIQRRLKSLVDEAPRTGLNELGKRVDDVSQINQEVLRGQRAAGEVREKDLKRTADIQAELETLRKRWEVLRGQNLLLGDTVKNTEKRLGELLSTESTRSQAQTSFLEEQARSQVERERLWKDWRERNEAILKQAEHFESQIHTIDETMRAAKRAQETYHELNTKLERRINEVTELQRLGEDRLRQEWIAFKSDDQKRWTGHALASEEALRDVRKDIEKIEATVSRIDDLAQLLQDQMHQTTDTAEQQLKGLMNVVHEWKSSYELIMGHNKKSARK